MNKAEQAKNDADPFYIIRIISLDRRPFNVISSFKGAQFIPEETQSHRQLPAPENTYLATFRGAFAYISA